MYSNIKWENISDYWQLKLQLLNELEQNVLVVLQLLPEGGVGEDLPLIPELVHGNLLQGIGVVFA